MAQHVVLRMQNREPEGFSRELRSFENHGLPWKAYGDAVEVQEADVRRK